MTEIQTNLFQFPFKLKGSPLTVKNQNFFQNVDFDSLKEAYWGTERNAQNFRTLSSTVTEEKTTTLKCPKFAF